MDISEEILDGLTEDVRQKVVVCTTPRSSWPWLRRRAWSLLPSR